MDRNGNERSNIDERRRREQALRAPERFYPRPEDVLDDDALSRADKLQLLRNWQVSLQDRGGAIGPVRLDHEIEDDEIADALREACRRAGRGDQ